MASLGKVVSVLALAAAIGLCALPRPSIAQSPPSPANPPAQADTFGTEVTLTAKPTIGIKGTANWDTAYETLVDTFKTLYAYLEKNGIKTDGPAMTIYVATDDSGFQFFAAAPVVEPPKEAPKGDMAVSKSPEGRALKFVHRGSYDSMDSTYEAITNYLDDKRLDAKDLFVEQYVTDIRTTPEENLVVEILVPLK